MLEDKSSLLLSNTRLLQAHPVLLQDEVAKMLLREVVCPHLKFHEKTNKRRVKEKKAAGWILNNNNSQQCA